jgi:catechol 2,3-dioxygenase-like lactoylglutathione lyase family enzyme
MLTGIAHVNLTVPTDTLDEAEAFYSNTLGMQRVPVPALQKDRLAWYVVSYGPSAISAVSWIKAHEQNEGSTSPPKVSKYTSLSVQQPRSPLATLVFKWSHKKLS